MSEDFDFLTGGIEQAKELTKHKIIVGVLLTDGDRTVEYNSMIANVQNDGATIKPVNGQYLTIPMPIAKGHRARDFDGLFFHLDKKGEPTLARNENGKLVVYFLLMKQVTIPARPFMDVTINNHINEVANMVADGVIKMYTKKTTAGELCDKIGSFLSKQMKIEMSHMNIPANAPITTAGKGFNNPLFDTGSLQRSISWVVV